MSFSPERNDSTAHLVLSIIEGHGFGFLQSPILIVAGTCGITLETEVVPPSPDPVFLVDLAWETNKKSLRRFRASNTPIKIECFTVGDNKERTGIGSVLLNIKSAQVVSNPAETKVTDRWHKLIGVPAEAKVSQPELLLNLKIQDKLTMGQPMSRGEQPRNYTLKDKLASKKLPVPDGDKISRAPSSVCTQEPIRPLLNSVNGYIQLGPENMCSSLFALTVIIGEISQLGMLLPEKETSNVQSCDSKLFKITCTVMNQSFSSKLFSCSDWNNTCCINETIVVRLRTSLSVLYTYLHENPSAPVQLLWDEEEVAAAELHLRSLVPTDNIHSFAREFLAESVCFQHCLWVSSHSGSIPGSDGSQPFVTVSTKLQLLTQPSSAFQKISTAMTLSKTISESSAMRTHESYPCGETIPSRSESRQSQDTFILTPQSGPKWVPVVPGPVQAQSTTLNVAAGVEPYVTGARNQGFALTIKLSTLNLQHPSESSHLRFSFQCSQKSILTSDLSDAVIVGSNEPILLFGICARIVFPSVSDGTEHTPDILIHVAEVTSSTTAQSFAVASVPVNLDLLQAKKDCPLSVPLRKWKGHEEVGILNGKLVFEELDTNLRHDSKKGEASHTQAISKPNYSPYLSEEFSVKKNGKDLQHFSHESTSGIQQPKPNECQILSSPSPPEADTSQKQPTGISCAPLDTNLAYRVVEELEDWKEKQQQIFHSELKRKEVDHLSSMSEEWSSKRKELETELDCKIAQCKALLKSLSDAREDLRERLKSCHLREQEHQKAKDELERQYNVKFQELTLAAKRLDEGVKLKVSLTELKCSQLEERLNAAESESETLRQQLRQRLASSNPAGDSALTCGMSHYQVTELLEQMKQLEEKLHSSVQSKAYFKEQWGRAVREMNQARAKFSQSTEKYGLEAILGKEETELQNDKERLDNLRKLLTGYKSGQTPSF